VTLLEQAARDNAEWCEAVSRSHGVRSRFTPDAWLAATRTPDFYPDAVTLRSSAGRTILRELDLAPGCSVKDSFAALDLADDGFAVTLDARWIFRAPDPEPSRSTQAVPGRPGEPGASDAKTRSPQAALDGIVWSVLEPEALGEWSALHSGVGTFRPSLLAEPGVVLLRADVAGTLVAGAVLSHTGAVVGISNVVSTPGTADDALWRGLTEQVSGRFPGLAMVGYESGADLIAPIDAGFTELGDLRVWVR